MLKHSKKKDVVGLFFAALFIVLSVYFDLTVPTFLNKITTELQLTTGSLNKILIYGGLMLAYGFASLIVTVITTFLSAHFSINITKNIRETLYDKVNTFSLNEINKFSISSLITRSTNDINQIQVALMFSFQAIIRSPILIIWALTKISTKGKSWTIATVTASISIFVFMAILIILTMPRFRKVQTISDELNNTTRDQLKGVRVIRAYNAQEYETLKTEKVNNKLTKNNLFTSRALAFAYPFISVIMNLLVVSIYSLGASLLNNASMSNRVAIFSDMMVFTSYAMQIMVAIILISIVFIILPRALVSAKRIREVETTKASIRDGSLERVEKGDIEFKNVSFKYGDDSEAIIKNLNFKLKAGDTLGLIGTTGSGKTTIINLLLRMYDPYEGVIKYNGIDIKEYNLEEYHRQIGYVPQKSVLFSTDIKNNLLLSLDDASIDDLRIKKALREADIFDFVDKEGGVSKKINQAGLNLSGGQKQRLSIARAIVKEPNLLIFDDSFSALDLKTDKIVRENLNKNYKNITKVIVAHRIATVKNSDLILVIDGGEIVEKGTHSQLMKMNGIYKEISTTQMKGLAND